MLVTLAVFHAARFPLNAEANENIFAMLVTLTVFQASMFPLKLESEKSDAILVTVEVSHVEISPNNVVAVVGSFTHATTAVPIL